MADFSIVVKSYAKALFLIAQDDNSLEEWIAFLESFSLLMSNSDFSQIIEHPVIDSSIKVSLFLDLMSLTDSTKESNFIELLIEKNRLSIISSILACLKEMKNEKEGLAVANIFTAFSVSDEQVDRMISIFEAKFKLKLKPQVLIDKSLIGGVKVVVGDKVLESSIRSKLNKMQDVLLTK